jgi:hypothetical protein
VIGRAEAVFWKIALLLTPWLAFAVVDRVVHGPGMFAWSAAIVLCDLLLFRFAPIDWMTYWLAWWVRVPTMPIRRLATRSWRRTLGVDLRPAGESGRALWIDARLTESERACLPRLDEAFEVIATLAPSRSARLARIAPQIVVAPIPAVGMYAAGVDVLLLNANLLMEPPGVIASVIVHECNHGWLNQQGYQHPLLERRLERLAVIDQWLFARRLGAAGRHAEANRVIDYLKANQRREFGLRARRRQMRDYNARQAAAEQPSE